MKLGMSCYVSTCQALEISTKEIMKVAVSVVHSLLCVVAPEESQRKEHVMDDVVIRDREFHAIMWFDHATHVIEAVCGACGDVRIQKGSANCLPRFFFRVLPRRDP